jgi:uncharacterized protein (TIGR02001 family)
MKKVVLSVVAALAASAAPALAADMPVKAAKVVAAPAPSPFDIAFGGAVMSDYNFRGVSQSNKGASGGAYFEPQFTVPFGTLYVGIAAWAIDWPSTPAYGFTDPSAEVDLYGGWRQTWGALSLDVGAIYYYYPKEIFNGLTAQSDFWEIYLKPSYAVTPDLTIGANVFYSPDVLHYSTSFCTATGGANCSKASAVYASLTAKWVTPWKVGDLGSYVSGEFGHWWINGSGFLAAGVALGTGYVDPDYTYWNVGLALTYKALTLDFRYHGTDQSALKCASFLVSAVGNPSNRWCNDTFIVSAKFDTTLSALK